MYKKIEIKEDCFGYNLNSKCPNCTALEELYCKKEICKFYKPSLFNKSVLKCNAKS